MDNALKQAIAQTRLFSDAQKIALLVGLDELSDDDRQTLKRTIDAFDASYAAAVSTFRNTVEKELEALNANRWQEQMQERREATETIQTGLGML